MADYAPDATPRVIYRYVNAGVGHNIMFRHYRGESEATGLTRASGAAFGLMSALVGYLCTDFTWVSGLYIPQDSSVGHPVATPTAVTGTNAPGGYSPEDKIRFLGFAGRSIGGSKISVKVFGTMMTTDSVGAVTSDFVMTSVENTGIANAIVALAAQNLPAIDNTLVTWYQRATIKLHDHWLRRVRQGIVA